jgi:hypothetical protein
LFHDGESMEDFAMRLNNLTNQLVTLDDPEPYDKVIDKYLCITRPRYKQLVVSIETLLDSMDLSVEEITGCLKAAEDDRDTGDGCEGEKFYLTEEQWPKRYKQKESSGSHRGGGSGGRGKNSRGNKKTASTGGGEGGPKPPVDRSKEK